MDWAKTTARGDEKHWSSGFGTSYITGLTVIPGGAINESFRAYLPTWKALFVTWVHYQSQRIFWHRSPHWCIINRHASSNMELPICDRDALSIAAHLLTWMSPFATGMHYQLVVYLPPWLLPINACMIFADLRTLNWNISWLKCVGFVHMSKKKIFDFSIEALFTWCPFTHDFRLCIFTKASILCLINHPSVTWLNFNSVWKI